MGGGEGGGLAGGEGGRGGWTRQLTIVLGSYIVPEIWGPSGSDTFLGGGLGSAVLVGAGASTETISLTMDAEGVGSGVISK